MKRLLSTGASGLILLPKTSKVSFARTTVTPQWISRFWSVGKDLGNQQESSCPNVVPKRIPGAEL